MTSFKRGDLLVISDSYENPLSSENKPFVGLCGSFEGSVKENGNHAVEIWFNQGFNYFCRRVRLKVPEGNLVKRLSEHQFEVDDRVLISALITNRLCKNRIGLVKQLSSDGKAAVIAIEQPVDEKSMSSYKTYQMTILTAYLTPVYAADEWRCGPIETGVSRANEASSEHSKATNTFGYHCRSGFGTPGYGNRGFGRSRRPSERPFDFDRSSGIRLGGGSDSGPGEAAIERLKIHPVTSSGLTVSQKTIQNEARRRLEAESRSAQSEERSAIKAPPNSPSVPSAVQSHVSDVKFTCELFGSAALTKAEMKERTKQHLDEVFHGDPVGTAGMMIHSLNPRSAREEMVNFLCDSILKNLINNPEEEKFRKLNPKNPQLKDVVLKFEGGEQFLRAIGFERSVDEKLVLPSEKYDRMTLERAGKVLRESQPIPMRLHRDPKTFLPSDKNLGADIELPSSFFVRTVDELRLEQAALSEEVSKMTSLRTRAMRERDQQNQHFTTNYKYCCIRIRFPDGFVLQGTFGVNESLKAVGEFVRENLERQSQSFQLLSPGRGRIDAGKSLAELKLVPQAVLHFHWDEENSTTQSGQSYLKQEVKGTGLEM